jgi:hypothetical protein
MKSFVISGRASTVFRLIELKAKQEQAAKKLKQQISERKYKHDGRD